MTLRLAVGVALAALTATPVMSQVRKQEMSGIRNYSRVDATVGCGGAVEPSAIAGLKKEGFVSVINLRQASEEGANVVVESVLAAVADRNNQPVFIHCGSANRVGGMWMIKRALQDQWPIEKALAEAQASGLNNPALTAFATEYINTHR